MELERNPKAAHFYAANDAQYLNEFVGRHPEEEFPISGDATAKEEELRQYLLTSEELDTNDEVD